jgi:hypothetical protein
MENTKTVPTNGKVCVKAPKGKKGGVTTEAMKKYGRNLARAMYQDGKNG